MSISTQDGACATQANSSKGTVTIFQYGAGTAGVFRTLGKYMGASGGMFAYALATNTVLLRANSWQRLHGYRQCYPPR